MKRMQVFFASTRIVPNTATKAARTHAYCISLALRNYVSLTLSGAAKARPKGTPASRMGHWGGDWTSLTRQTLVTTICVSRQHEYSGYDKKSASKTRKKQGKRVYMSMKSCENDFPARV